MGRIIQQDNDEPEVGTIIDRMLGHNGSQLAGKVLGAPDARAGPLGAIRASSNDSVKHGADLDKPLGPGGGIKIGDGSHGVI
jgi:hypothetical protein